MSTRIFDAYLYDKSEDELILELNTVKDQFHEYLENDIRKDPNKWMRWGTYMVDHDSVDPAEHLLKRALRYIKAGLYTQERGNPLDIAGDCVVVKHAGKIILWLFPGFRFEQFAKENEILRRIMKNEYWYDDSGDCEWDSSEEEAAYAKRGEFWRSAFEHYQTYVPSRMGLGYEFFAHNDAFELADLLCTEYGRYLKNGGL